MDIGGLPSNANGPNGSGGGGDKASGPATGSGSGSVPAQTDIAIQAALETLNEDLGRGLPDNQRVRTQLRFDEDAARLVAEVVDGSGLVVDSFPPDLVLKAIARNCEALGPLISFQA